MTICRFFRDFSAGSRGVRPSTGAENGCYIANSPNPYPAPSFGSTYYSYNLDYDNLKDTETGTRSRANLTWHVTPDVMLYYTFSQGFRPGGSKTPRLVRRAVPDGDAPDRWTHGPERRNLVAPAGRALRVAVQQQHRLPAAGVHGEHPAPVYIPHRRSHLGNESSRKPLCASPTHQDGRRSITATATPRSAD